MAKIVSFRPNHKIFSGFVARSEFKKKSIQEFLEKINFNENHREDCDFEKRPFTTQSTVQLQFVEKS
jgi:hypothetical protein